MIDINKFCAKATAALCRPQIESPWSVGDNTFATNGHIIIRVSRRVDVPERKNAPGLKALQDSFFKEPEKWYSIPAVSPKEEPCKECHGKGKHRYHGSSIPCEDCGGTGKILPHKRIAIGEGGFSDVYLSWIAELPGAEIGPFKAEEPARFRFEGGDGLLMGMRS